MINLQSIQKCSGQMCIALLIVMGFFYILYHLLSAPIPPENKDLVNVLLGVLSGTGFAAVISYYFGSSIGSRNKENTIEKLSTGPTVTETTTQGVGDSQTTKTTTTQPAGGTAPVAVNLPQPQAGSPPVTVTVTPSAPDMPIQPVPGEP